MHEPLFMVAWCRFMHPERYEECLEHDALVAWSRAFLAANGVIA